MPHDISHESGRAELAYVGESPWHRLGVRVNDSLSAQEMIEAAGLAWTVSLSDVYANLDGTYTPVSGYRVIMRDDTRTVLGISTNRYYPIQNRQAAEVLEALIGEGVRMEVAGALGRGERCWALARVGEGFTIVRDDIVNPYVLVAWGHDGKHSLAIKLTPIRVVCHNTLTTALPGRWRDSADVYIRHRAQARIRIDEARRALGLVATQTAAIREVYQQLAATPIEAATYVAGVFPYHRESTDDDFLDEKSLTTSSSRARLQIDKTRDQVLQLIARDQSAPGSAWQAYNGVTEWADHVYPILASGKVSETRWRSVLFGSYARLKARALELALSGSVN